MSATPLYLLTTKNDASSNPIHILTNGKASFGSNSDRLITDSSGILASCSLNVGRTKNQTNSNVYGTYYSNNESATRIAYDTSANRPYPGYPGYIRYNTDTNLIEYWNNLTNSWLPISQVPPEFTSISPNYVLEDVSGTTYTITGQAFNSSSFVSFIGFNNSVTYPSASTTYISQTQLQATTTFAMVDASVNTGGFYVKVTNQDTGFATTSPTPALFFNLGPIFTSTGSLGSTNALAGLTYTYATSPFTDMSAIDVSNNYPINYYYRTAPSTGTGSVLLDPSGRLYGTMPNVVTGPTTYSFSAYPQDASGAIGGNGNFTFTVYNTSLTVSGFTLNTDYSYNYIDPSGNVVATATTTTDTVYRFFGTKTGTVTPNFDASINYLVVAGGGGGGSGVNGSHYGGGGGAGGYRAGLFNFAKNTAYDVIVGAGGSYTNSNNVSGGSGGASRLGPSGSSGISTTGGGGGASGGSAAGSGGSGGGGNYITYTSGAAGNAGGYAPVEGYAGSNYWTGGQGAPGGGSVGVGTFGITDASNGSISNITGSYLLYANGGNGNPSGGAAFLVTGSGNGGAGGNSGLVGQAGSSGSVIIRFPSLITYTGISGANRGTVAGFYPGQFTITYVNSSNTIINYPAPGGFTIYTFLAPQTGTFTPNFSSSSVDFLVIGGGGSGGGGGGDQVGAGGGGAGGYRTSYPTGGGAGTSGGGASAESKLTITSGVPYTVTVGLGGVGTAATVPGGNGNPSTFSTITSQGGGAGGGTGGNAVNATGAAGGSGGGANAYATSAGSGTANQGFAGYKTSTTSISGGGGGGGAGSTGNNASGTASAAVGGAGGSGISSSITGISVTRAGGGGGGAYSTGASQSGGAGGSGGGGSGASSVAGSNIPGGGGAPNTGSGGGGAAGGGGSLSNNNPGGNGGTGIVIIRFPSF